MDMSENGIMDSSFGRLAWYDDSRTVRSTYCKIGTRTETAPRFSSTELLASFFVPCRSLLLTQCYRGKQLTGSGFAAPAPANDTHIVET